MEEGRDILETYMLELVDWRVEDRQRTGSDNRQETWKLDQGGER